MAVRARFPFHFEGVVGLAARVVTLGGRRAWVEVTDATFTARYGPWVVRTPLANIATTASVSGPYRWWKVIGPAHLSFVDRGLTFASNATHGVCIEFVEPVTGMDFLGRLRHPGLTVTVDDADGLVAALTQT